LIFALNGNIILLNLKLFYKKFIQKFAIAKEICS